MGEKGLRTATGRGTKGPMSVIAGLTAAKATLELTTKVMDLLNRPNVDVHAVRGHVQEMLIHVVNAQVALGEAHVEISDLRHELEDREAIKALEADMDFRVDGGFFVRKSEAQKGLIAYCPVCWKKDGYTIPLRTSETPGWYHCSVHNTVFETAASREYQRRQAIAGSRSPGGGSGSWM